jgi:cation diffusion facilitator CzcD-associated flavoprotein CzcO
MRAYLERYAERFDLVRRICFGSRVKRLERTDEGTWLIRSASADGETNEIYANVVVATGPQGVPFVPEIEGIEGFTGALGVAHTTQFDGVSRYRGRSVVVAGCSISALEIASALALGGAGEVTTTYRRQRYILPKLITGVPTEHVLFNRAAALAGEIAPPEVLMEQLKAAVLAAAGSPGQFGAMEPDLNIFAAGITQAQNFLPSVAEGRITVRPWIDRIEGNEVHFADGSSVKADAILFGTGYQVALPWFAKDIAGTLNLDDHSIDLHGYTFHPDLPGLSFVGQFKLEGPYFPVLELQARWIAYTLAGLVPAPSRDEMLIGCAESRAKRERNQTLTLQDAAIELARHAGVEPDLDRWPEIERALLFGPLSAVSFRLDGPDSLEDAAERTKAAAAAFGRIRDETLTPEEAGLRQLVHPAARSAAA